MSRSPPLKVAGIGLSWDEKYAIAYCNRLFEMGFFAKRYEAAEGKFLVGYSHRDFTLPELEVVLDHLIVELKKKEWHLGDTKK